MNDGATFILGSLGIVAATFLLMPWVVIGLEAYWSWRLRIQRGIQKRRRPQLGESK